MSVHPHKWRFRPGAPRIWYTPEAYAESWGLYFDECLKHKLIPTFAGAAIHMGVHQRTLRDYGFDRGDEFKQVHKAAMEYLEAMVVDRILNKPNPVGAIFYICNRFKRAWTNHHMRPGAPAGESGSGSAGAEHAAPETNSIMVIPFNEGQEEHPFQAAPSAAEVEEPPRVTPDPDDEEAEEDGDEDEAGDYA